MSYYSHHVFFCCNQRQNGERCCNDSGASDVRDYAKKKVKELRAEITAGDVMTRALGQSRQSLLDVLESALSMTSPEALLAMPRDTLADFVLQAGFGLTIDDFDLIHAHALTN